MNKGLVLRIQSVKVEILNALEAIEKAERFERFGKDSFRLLEAAGMAISQADVEIKNLVD